MHRVRRSAVVASVVLGAVVVSVARAARPDGFRAGVPPATDRFTLVDSIEHVGR